MDMIDGRVQAYGDLEDGLRGVQPGTALGKGLVRLGLRHPSVPRSYTQHVSTNLESRPEFLISNKKVTFQISFFFDIPHIGTPPM